MRQLANYVKNGFANIVLTLEKGYNEFVRSDFMGESVKK